VALGVSTRTLFVPLLPAMLAGLLAVFAIAAHLGRRERRRLAAAEAARDVPAGDAVVEAPPERPHEYGAPLGARWYVNVTLTAATLVALFTEVVPLPLAFVVAAALALAVNAPDVHAQRERLTAHGSAAMMMVTTVFAAGIFTGILTGSGMLRAMSGDLVRALPDGLLRHLPLALAPASMPLSLVFDPDSFYFGLLPVVAEASRALGGSAVEVGRAALLGQMTTGFPVSPLTPATFLLVGLAGVDLAEHQRRTIGYAFAVTLVMTLAAVATRAIGAV
jgi:CitMHS family citrate-Mg2+:H+ or citrate-Ca2+:H+ symporter